MNRVLPGLFIGNYRDSKDAHQLERHKITHIIAIHDAARRLHTDKEYLCITASDTPFQNLAQYFPTCNDFIHTARLQGGNVLIHCLAGMSRSVTIAVAYIMSITSLRWNEALKVVRGARAVSNPNSGFQKQLQEFESTKLSDERRRLVEKFPAPTPLDHDDENCRRLLIAYQHLLLSKAICEGRCVSARICPTGTCRAQSASRFARQKSTEGSGSLRGSTQSLDSSSDNVTPESPKRWQRHYGCWKNHVRNQTGSSSTPASPILYRASKSKSQRSDSMLSISSISSVTSLPAQDMLEKEESPRRNIVDRNPLLFTQSCPNSPRRMPRKPGPPVQSQLRSREPGVSPSEVMKLLNKDKRTTTTHSTSAASSLTLPKPASVPELGILHEKFENESPSSPHRFTPNTSQQQTLTGSQEGPITTAAAAAAATPSSTRGSKNTIKVASGITRWVMKRSAYRFSFDKS